MNWWHGKARCIFLGLLVLVATIRFLTLRPPQYQDGDRVRLVFKVTNPESVRFHDISIKNLREKVSYGDQLIAIGTLKAKENRGYWLSSESIQVTSAKSGLNTRLNSLRMQAINRLVEYLPRPEGALAAGIFLGGTEKMSRVQTMAFRRTGLTHLVAASGYNVTLIVVWSGVLFSRLVGRRFMLPMVILTTIIYMGLAGMTPSVVRAGIMSIAAFVGVFFGRQSDARWLLTLTALGMLIWNPDYLGDIGWQLSIAATAGLVLFSPRGDWWTTIAAQITTLPLILHYFGNLSVIAPLANLLVLALMPLAIQITALSLAIGLIFPLAGQIVSWLAWPLLKFTNETAIWLSNLPFSSFTVRPMSWLWVIGYYFVVLWLYRRFKKRY